MHPALTGLIPDVVYKFDSNIPNARTAYQNIRNKWLFKHLEAAGFY